VHEKESGVLFFVFEFMEGNLFTRLRSYPDGMPEEAVRHALCVTAPGRPPPHPHTAPPRCAALRAFSC
jgi:hypothetical protein